MATAWTVSFLVQCSGLTVGESVRPMTPAALRKVRPPKALQSAESVLRALIETGRVGLFNRSRFSKPGWQVGMALKMVTPLAMQDEMDPDTGMAWTTEK
jgi:hypothetical protein